MLDWLLRFLGYDPTALTICLAKQKALMETAVKLRQEVSHLEEARIKLRRELSLLEAENMRLKASRPFPPIAAKFNRQLRFAGNIHSMYLPLDQPAILGTDAWQADWEEVYRGITVLIDAALTGSLYPDLPEPPDIQTKWNKGEYKE